MTALNLTPKDVNYLTSRLVSQNMIQNAVALTLDADNVSADPTATPKIHLDGQGRAHLTGAMIVENASPSAGMVLFTMPDSIPLLNPISIFPVTTYNATTYAANFLTIYNGTNSIASIAITTPGEYTGIPSANINGIGTGFVGSTRVKVVIAEKVTSQSGSGSYAPGDTFELTGGTAVGGAKFTGSVVTTRVVSMVVNAAGSGGTDGSQTLTGTTGTGTKFTLVATITGGAITGISSYSPGLYTVNPTDLTAEPVTGASLTGATVTLKMSVVTTTITNYGVYSVLPTLSDPEDPYPTTATSGTGTGLTFSLTWGVDSVSVTSGGHGYNSSAQVEFTGGGKIEDAIGVITLSNSPTVPTGVLSNTITEDDVIYLDGVVLLTESY